MAPASLPSASPSLTAATALGSQSQKSEDFCLEGFAKSPRTSPSGPAPPLTTRNKSEALGVWVGPCRPACWGAQSRRLELSPSACSWAASELGSHFEIEEQAILFAIEQLAALGTHHILSQCCFILSFSIRVFPVLMEHPLQVRRVAHRVGMGDIAG